MQLLNKEIKLISNLHQKKFRQSHQLFIVEGQKSIDSFLSAGWHCEILVCNNALTSSYAIKNKRIADDKLFKKLSLQKKPQGVLGVFKQKTLIRLPQVDKQNQPLFYLDNVQDPGNFGAIIRSLHWFGFSSLLCSDTCVETYNPKVVQATMGSLTAVSIFRMDYKALLDFCKSNKIHLIATTANQSSKNINKIPERSLIILGNEAGGISKHLIENSDEAVCIQSFAKNPPESINVSVAASIFMWQFMSNAKFKK